ncbi:MAG: hypothetical protein AAF198_07600 [Pseudomonadota bacterium]
MSNTDSFIDEVNEEFRNDKLYAFMRRWAWLGVLIILGIVAAVVASEYLGNQKEAEAAATGDALTEAFEAETPPERAAALAAVADTKPNATFIAELARAGELASVGQTEDAIAALDAAIASAPQTPVFLDMVALKKVLLPGNILSGDERVAILAPASQAGRPYRLFALEQLAYAQLAAGDEDGAVSSFETVAQAAEVSQDMRARANQMILVLGGDAAE